MANFLTGIATNIAQNPGIVTDAAYHPSANTGDLPLDSPADGSINSGGGGYSTLKSSTAHVGYA